MLDVLRNDPQVQGLVSRVLRARAVAGGGVAGGGVTGRGVAGGGVMSAARVVCRGTHGSSTVQLSGVLQQACNRTVVLVVAHVDDADGAYEELISGGVVAQRFPALETLPGESGVSIDALAERLSAMDVLTRWREPVSGVENAGGVLVAPIAALMQPVPTLVSLEGLLRWVQVGQEVRGGPAGLARWLEGAGYERVETIEEPGQFAVRGGILDVFPPGDAGASGAEVSGEASLGGVPVRVDFFGDEVEKLHEVDLESMGVDRAVRRVQLVCAKPELAQPRGEGGSDGGVGLMELLPSGCVVVLHELLELTEQARGYFERVLDGWGVLGPPAVFAGLQRHSACVVEVSSMGPAVSLAARAVDGGTAGTRASGNGATGGRVTGKGGLSGRASGGATVVQEVLDLPIGAVPPVDDDVEKAVAELVRLASGAEGPAVDVRVMCASAAELARLEELLTAHARGVDGGDESGGESGAESDLGRVRGELRVVQQGFMINGVRPTLVLPYGELLHRFTARRRSVGPKLRAGRAMDTFIDLRVGDYVVHSEHGIAKFVGLEWLRPRDVKRSVQERLEGLSATAASEGEAHEHLVLEFDSKARLYVPAVKVDQVSKYVGGFRGKPPLSVLGGERWKNQKSRTSESVRDLAAEMLRVRAARERLPGIRYPADTAWQSRFEEEFPHTETDDQLAAMAEIKRDMASARPMDRLLCGDVGFGKTEIAIRAAFKAAEFGKQVAVLVPTTVLAEQHERTFKGRFADYPFKIESLSRFKDGAQERQILADLAAGRVDVIIGTHRLLSKDVRFADLGLVVIDEEQRFGVEHKERLLGLRLTADILTLSATPIPRTLHMSMLGLRDISSLTTAPVDRRAVVTEVVPRNPVRLKQVIERELNRQGQVFYVHNRVHDILSVADGVQKLAPGARIVVGHGQMGDGELERVILAFVRGQADILVSTTIIESGIDIPRANTMVIEDADRFGLAELHQLRGRVGRSKHRGYCYLLLPDGRPLREHAKQRLKALEQFSMLGAGFKIAMRDLEIRGAGNLLGAEQSGHIAAVGYDMYCQLLDRAVKQLKNEQVASPSETSIDVGITGFLPKALIPSDVRRIEAYRRVALCGSQEELTKVRQDLVNAYGELPGPTLRLLDLAELRVGCRDAGVRSVIVREPDVILRSVTPQVTAERLFGAPGKVTVLPPKERGQSAEVYFRPDNVACLEPPTLLAILRKRLCVALVPTVAAEGAGVGGGVMVPGTVARQPLVPAPARVVARGRAGGGGGVGASGKPPPLSAEMKSIKRGLRRG